jgi:hypothetical protein
LANQHTSPWTRDKDNELIELTGTMSFNAIAKRLGRTPNSVERRLTRLGHLNTKMASGLLSARDLSLALNVDYKVLYRWMDKFNLPLRIRRLNYMGKRKNERWYIDTEEFWKWAESHKDLVNFARIQPMALLPEPSWFNEERRKANAKAKSQWTPEEDEQVWKMFYNKGMPQKQIAIIIGRTQSSVEGRLRRLRRLGKK